MESDGMPITMGIRDAGAPIEEFLKVLYEHKKSCEKEGKFQEAEDAVNRIQELRLQEEKQTTDRTPRQA